MKILSYDERRCEIELNKKLKMLVRHNPDGVIELSLDDKKRGDYQFYMNANNIQEAIIHTQRKTDEIIKKEAASLAEERRRWQIREVHETMKKKRPSMYSVQSDALVYETALICRLRSIFDSIPISVPKYAVNLDGAREDNYRKERFFSVSDRVNMTIAVFNKIVPPYYGKKEVEGLWHYKIWEDSNRNLEMRAFEKKEVQQK